jgi:hypothetical protein
MKMTSIFTKVKAGDLITSDLFNQITGKIEEIDEITSVMEVKKNSETNASEPGKLTIKGNLCIGTKESPSEKLEVNGTVETGKDGQFLVVKSFRSSKKGEESSMNLDFMTSSQDRTSLSIPTASFRAIDDDKSSHLGFFTNEAFTNELSEDQNKLTERLRITSNGKIGIGTTEPSEKLEVNGAVKASRYLGDGSGLTGIKTGQWKDTPDGISYTAGNVGIGSDNPQYPLDVKASKIKLGLENNGGGQLVITNIKDDNSIYLEAFNSMGNESASEIVISGIAAKNVPKLSMRAANTIFFGNVGIGTDNPSEKLEVNGTVKADKFIGDGSELKNIKTGQWTDVTGGISYNSGNVGIGTTKPFCCLDVRGKLPETTGNYDPIITIGPPTGETAVLYRGYNGKTTYLGIESYTVDNKPVKTPIVLQEYGGNVGIGTTAPSAKLEVNGDIKVSGKIIQEDWKAVDLLNGWKIFKEIHNNPLYFIDKSGIVHIVGAVYGGELGKPIFNLTEGYRPAKWELHTVWTYPDTPGRCDILPDGNVILQKGDINWVFLDGITFRAVNY